MKEPDRKNEIVRVVIPTYKRAGRVSTMQHFGGCCLCVSKAEAPEYREQYENVEIVEHPDSIRGYSPKAQWILDKFGSVFLLDDDLTGLIRKYHPKGGGYDSKVDRDTAYHLIQATASIAKQMGAFLFGFSHVPNPLTYHGFTPYRLKGFIQGGACGYLAGSKLAFDTKNCVAASDYWMSCLNAYWHRYCFVDERFCVVDDGTTFANSGGVAEYRNLETEEEDVRQLRIAFGDVIQKKQKAPPEVKKNLVNPFEKTIHLPF